MIIINIKSFFSIYISKTIKFLSQKFLKGGTNFPGIVALKLDKNVLKELTYGYKIILVTGTNGKTTTTSMIYNILKESNKKVITNASGANMKPGIVSCFLSHYSIKAKGKEKFAIIEVDEAYLKHITSDVKPEMIIVTNLFRDQLDRYGEVYTTLNMILDGIKNAPSSTLLLNGDESLLGDLNLKNNTLYYGFNASPSKETKVDINADAKFCKSCGSSYSYNFLTYNHLGDFFCENCGYKRPFLDYSVNNIVNLSPDGSTVVIGENEVFISQAGVYNIYNGLCAYSAAKLLSIKDDFIISSLANQKSSFGRQEIIKLENKNLRIILVKNPAGCDEAINTVTLDKSPITLGVLLNDNYADGTDISWIWDAKFENLSSLDNKKVLVGGVRLYDMAIRLKTANLDTKLFSLCENYDKLLEEMTNCPTENIYLLATYTAMTSFRKYLHNKGYISNLWS